MCDDIRMLKRLSALAEAMRATVQQYNQIRDQIDALLEDLHRSNPVDVGNVISIDFRDVKRG